MKLTCFRLFRSLAILSVLAISAWTARSATWHVAQGGNDSGAGTESTPWKTIQRGLTAAAPGDTLVVHDGIYEERNTSVRGGSADQSRITLRASGSVTNKGFSISHPYITIDGFHITGHSATDVYDAHVAVKRGGDQFRLYNTVVKDGVHAVLTNAVFTDNNPNPDSIAAADFDFAAAGFKPGQRLNVGNAAARIVPLNRDDYTITAVGPGLLTVSAADAFVADGPTTAYLSASRQYGLYLDGRVGNCIIAGNTFTNLSYDSLFIGGMNHLIESNLVTASQGWDAMHYMGTNHVFRKNIIRSSPLVVHQVSPDVFENWITPYDNILFTNNWVDGFTGVLGSLKNSMEDTRTLTITHNVFRNVGRFVFVFANTRVENNLFLNVSSTSSPVNSSAPHALRFTPISSFGAVLRNNIFVGCGEGRTPATQGWYEFDVSEGVPIIERNFVAGPAPGYATKTNYPEPDALLNGGDPGFVNLEDPLGPDGQPFTADDGLRFRSSSKLRGAGVAGLDLGPYSTSVAAPRLGIVPLSDHRVRITLPILATDTAVESRVSPLDPWSRITTALITGDNLLYVDVPSTNPAAMFRAVR